MPLAFFVLATILWSCGGKPETSVAKGAGGYLDTAYVSKSYRAHMDSIQSSSDIEPADFKQLQGYMREFRDSIAGHPTYRELLERAKGLKEMRNAAIGMKVKSMSIHHDQKWVEIRLVLTFVNEMATTLGGFRGEISWLDEAGKKVTATPFFSVRGPIAPGDSIRDLRLEYVMYKPTGNELNDPRNQALRDTLEGVEAVAKKKDLNAFRFKLLDIRLQSGLTPGQYWLKSAEERKRIDDQGGKMMPEPMQLLQWAKEREDWMTKLQAHNSPYNLVISPVLTTQVEASHGKKLILDRVQKVYDFFDREQQIHKANINQSTTGKRLLLAEYVDFWNWPMDIRIYQK